MKKVSNNQEINEIIHNSKMAVIYFTGMDCGACEVIKYKIEEILKRFPNIQSVEINSEENLEVCASYNVFSVPVFLLYIEQKECLRIGRNVDLYDLEEKIKRYYEMIFI